MYENAHNLGGLEECSPSNLSHLLYIHQFGKLGDSVIANRHSTVANGDFDNRVGNNPGEFEFIKLEVDQRQVVGLSPKMHR